LDAGLNFPNYQLVIAAAPGQNSTLYENIAAGRPIKMVSGQTYDLLKTARAAVVTSGTATLETALIGCPEVVVYKSSPISYAIGRQLVKVKYISLVNLILDKPLLIELIQNECNPKQISFVLKQLLNNKKAIE